MKMGTGICLEGAFLVDQYENNHPKYGHLGSVIGIVQTMLHQGTHRTIGMFLSIVVMVLGNGQQARYQQRDNDELGKLHLGPISA